MRAFYAGARKSSIFGIRLNASVSLAPRLALLSSLWLTPLAVKATRSVPASSHTWQVTPASVLRRYSVSRVRDGEPGLRQHDGGLVQGGEREIHLRVSRYLLY